MLAMPDGVTVSELCASVEASISGAFPDEIWVRGAISGISRSANGHVYFDLVDPGDLGGPPTAVLPVALFANARFRVNAILRKTNAIRMRDGVEIQIRGRVAYYPRQGRIQLLMSLIDPAFTLGQLEMARAELLAELASRDLIDANRRLPFPVVPLRVALITSAGSAAEADFITELRSSGYRFDVTLYDSRVQGDEAVGSLAAAIAAASEAGGDHHDVIAMVRGGGARTDLVAFDHRDVVLAITASTLPVVVGIGHEIDRSVADAVAAATTKTPTACAGLLAAAVDGFAQGIEQADDRLHAAAQHHLRTEDTAIGRAGTRLDRVARAATLTATHTLEQARQRLASRAQRSVDLADHQLTEAALRVRSVDPAIALARGWAIVHDAEGALVRSLDQVTDGATLHTRVADGVIESRVEGRMQT